MSNSPQAKAVQQMRCISPTKTLDYIAAGKSVVTRPVVDAYGDAVSIAADAGPSVQDCSEALSELQVARVLRRRAAATVVARYSSDTAVARAIDWVTEARGATSTESVLAKSARVDRTLAPKAPATRAVHARSVGP